MAFLFEVPLQDDIGSNQIIKILKIDLLSFLGIKRFTPMSLKNDG